MNILLWVLQILLALHTIIGAVWKFSNSEQVVESMNRIPHIVWLFLAIIEILCSLGLILPIFKKSMGKLVPLSAIFIAAEMLFYCGIDIFSGTTHYNHVIYWLVISIVSAFIAFGRSVLKPIQTYS